MADQLTDLPDSFQSGEDVSVNKQVSLFLELTKKAKKQGHVYPGPCGNAKHRQNTLIKITLHHKSSPYVCGMFTTELSTVMVDGQLNALQNVI